MRIDRTSILILNYNGRALLEECLPSVVAASARSPVPCTVSVIDNSSTDHSVAWLAEHWPEITVHLEPNRALASFNTVLARLTEPAVLLLNNDIKLDPNAVGPLLKSLEVHPDALFSAPQCWTFDGQTYEGMRTRVRMRFGLIQGLCRVPGFEASVTTADLTASAGPILAVNRQRFLELGGYDPLYFPGRIEDLDLGFNAWMRGWKGYYVPESLAYHKGFASFEPAFGQGGCDLLAARNSLLFAWKNLTGLRLIQHAAWLPARLAYAVTRGRTNFLQAFCEACLAFPQVRNQRRLRGIPVREWTQRQEAFFRQFHW